MKFVPFDLDVAKREVEGHSIASIQIHQIKRVTNKVPYICICCNPSKLSGCGANSWHWALLDNWRSHLTFHAFNSWILVKFVLW